VRLTNERSQADVEPQQNGGSNDTRRGPPYRAHPLAGPPARIAVAAAAPLDLTGSTPYDTPARSRRAARDPPVANRARLRSEDPEPY